MNYYKMSHIYTRILVKDEKRTGKGMYYFSTFQMSTTNKCNGNGIRGYLIMSSFNENVMNTNTLLSCMVL